MRKTAWMLVGSIGLAAAPLLPAIAAESDGSIVADSGVVPWERWQGRLSLGSSTSVRGLADRPGLSLNTGASLMGDYYFSRSLNPISGSGFRATSGLVFGPRGLLSTGQPGLSAGNAFSIGSRLFGTAPTLRANDLASEVSTLPYLGLGYTSLAPRTGLSFSADLGLIGQSGGGLKPAKGPSLDDTVRELRLAPLLQVGVSYAF